MKAMRAICVDDEKLLMERTVALCREVPGMDEVAGFTNPREALEWVSEHPVDLALLDVEMPSMTGIELAAAIKQRRPDTAVIFLTAYPKYAVDAFAVRASGYLLKPVTLEALAADVRHAMTARPKAMTGHVAVRTFGGFDVLVDGRVVQFKRAKSKEILAFLVDRQGATVTRAELFAALWEDRAYDRGMQKQLDIYTRSLRDTLREYKVEEIIEARRGLLRVKPEKIVCDLYRFLEGDADAVASYRGEYMSAYPWADITEGLLTWRKPFNSGGAIFIGDDTTTIEGGTFTNNEASDHGGAIYVNNSTLKLYGGSLTGNSAQQLGGGVLVGSNGKIRVKGKPVVKNNAAEGGDGSDIYLRGGKKIELDGVLTGGAQLGVSAEKLDKAFSRNFNANNENADPATYFTTEDGWVVLKSGNEARIHQSTWPLLQALIDAATYNSTIVLDRDYKGCANDSALTLPWDKTLTIDLNGHTLDRGLTRAVKDGAVIMNNGILAIKDSKGGGVITGGWSTGDGGGIWNYRSLSFQGGTITGNRAQRGGGVYTRGGLDMIDGVVSNNTATADGGGIFVDGERDDAYIGGQANISGGEITGNTAGLNGGAVCVMNDGELVIYGGTMTGNVASRGNGGAIDLSGARQAGLRGGTITGNKAALEGGGVVFGTETDVYASGAPVVTGNAAGIGANVMIRAGGLIEVTDWLSDGAKLDLLAQDPSKKLTWQLTRKGRGNLNAFTYNEGKGVSPTLKDGELFVDMTVTADVWVSDWDGLQTAVKNAMNGRTIGLSADISCKQNGGDRIKVEGGKSITLELNGHTLNRNRTKSDSDGHVIEVKDKSTLTIQDGVGTGKITGGYATRGGGINIQSGSTCILKGGTVNGNQAEWGGGVYAHGTFRMESGTISGNNASKSGGGIHCGREGALNLTGGIISDNTATDAAGVYNSGSKDVTLTNVQILNNVNSEHGGAGFNNNDGGAATLKNCVIRGNAAAGDGGGLWNQEDSSLTLENCVIEENTSGAAGGGIFTRGTVTITGGAIRGNTAQKEGGGIRLWHGATTVNSSEITGNTAKDGHGGGIYVGGATLKLYGGRITGNTASGEGGGIRIEQTDDGKVNIHGAPVVRDNAASNGADIFLREKMLLTVDAPMTKGAEVHVTPEDIAKVFTSGLGAHNGGDDPQNYFRADTEAHTVNFRDGEALVNTTDWSNLQRQIDAAKNGDTIKLNRIWRADAMDQALVIPSGRTITIDLNGHTLNRGLNAALADGAVIRNSGTLTVRDSVGGGAITGGYTSGDGGGIWNEGTLTLEGGAITGNHAQKNGGGVYNDARATLNLKGGEISNNYAGSEGGGAYTNGVLEQTGGEFKGNSALTGGGMRINGGTATVAGGVMTGNAATAYHGGAIYIGGGTLNLYGGTLTGNRATMEGGGILYGAGATLNVKGAPVVKDNSAPTGANLLLQSDGRLELTGRLAKEALLDVTTKKTDAVMTHGLAQNGSLDNFTYDDGNRKPVLKDGELFVDMTVNADVWVTDWKGLQDAVKKAADG